MYICISVCVCVVYFTNNVKYFFHFSEPKYRMRRLRERKNQAQYVVVKIIKTFYTWCNNVFTIYYYYYYYFKYLCAYNSHKDRLDGEMILSNILSERTVAMTRCRGGPRRDIYTHSVHTGIKYNIIRCT